MLLAGRLLVGLGIGVSSMLAPLYLAETAPAESRGAMVSLNQLMITIGILVSYLVGYAFAASGGWRWMLGLGALPGADPGRRHAGPAGVAALARRPRPLGRRAPGPAGAARIERDARQIEAELDEIEADLAARGAAAQGARVRCPTRPCACR